jgi:hypothetical protein
MGLYLFFASLGFLGTLPCINTPTLYLFFASLGFLGMLPCINTPTCTYIWLLGIFLASFAMLLCIKTWTRTYVLASLGFLGHCLVSIHQFVPISVYSWLPWGLPCINTLFICISDVCGPSPHILFRQYRRFLISETTNLSTSPHHILVGCVSLIFEAPTSVFSWP